MHPVMHPLKSLIFKAFMSKSALVHWCIRNVSLLIGELINKRG